MSYLINRYKGTYRLLAPINDHNQFSRKLDNTYEDIDVYIDCSKGQIFYYGNAILEGYVPSLQTGRGMVRQIYATYINPNNVTISQKEITTGKGNGIRTIYTINDEELYKSELKALTKKDIIFDIMESDEEVFFKFKAENDDKIIPLFKPKTSGANRSPFSSKNLLKADYTIPEEDLKLYKDSIGTINISDGSGLKLNRITKDYLNTLTNKRYTMDKLKEDMAKSMLKGKEYIHSIGKWNEYIKYLKQNL